MVVLFIWVISFMVMHPWWVVYFYRISIVVIHIFIILMPKDAKLIMIVQHICGCRLGHIDVKRMKKLHADGLLESLDYESFDTCESCLVGKMTKNSVLRNNGASNRVIVNHTYWWMWSNEHWGSRRMSLFSHLHRWFEQIWVYLLDETQVWNILKVQRISEWSGESS